MNYLTEQEILVIHSEIIDITGGSHGVRDIGLLISITNKPKMKFGGKVLYKTIFDKAATYLESLINFHVFIDGNKRTAITATARFLHKNGYELKVKNKKMELFVLSIIKKKPELNEISKWIKKNSK